MTTYESVLRIDPESRFRMCMAHDQLDAFDIHSVFYYPGAESMPEIMACELREQQRIPSLFLCQPCLLLIIILADPPQHAVDPVPVIHFP